MGSSHHRGLYGAVSSVGRLVINQAVIIANDLVVYKNSQVVKRLPLACKKAMYEK